MDNLHVCEQAGSGRSVCNSSLENLCIIINSACIAFYFYLPLRLWRSVPVSGCVITDCMCIMSLDSVCFSLSLCISVVVFGDIVAHCTRILSSLDSVFLSFSFSLNTSFSVRLYCHWLYVQKYVSWSAFLSLSVCLFQCLLIFSVIVCVCVRPLILFLSLSLSLNAILSLIVGVYVHLLIRVCLSLFVWIFLSVFGYVVTYYTCIGTSLDPRFSLFRSICLSVWVYYRFFLLLGISILGIGYIITHCTCICPVSWSAFLSLSHWMPISVFGYIVIDCNYVGTYLDRRFSLSLSFSLILSECVYQCPVILSVIVGIYVRLLIRVSLSLSVSLNVSVTVRLHLLWLIVRV